MTVLTTVGDGCPAWKYAVPTCGTHLLASPLVDLDERAAGPEAMRAAMASYVAAVHGAYLDAVAVLPPADRARLPLLRADEITVAAVGTRYLHVVATADPLPSPQGQEVEVVEAIGDLRWRLRFYDPVIVPGLGLLDETAGPAQEEVRSLLGLRTHLYHLAVPPGSGLSAHHAQHAGTGLGHAHAAAERDYSTLASLLPGRTGLVEEMHGCEVAGLPRAALLVARSLAPTAATLAEEPLENADAVRSRRLLLDHLRRPA